jgi:hypothetical protein
MILFATGFSELFSAIFNTQSPLTKYFIKMGRTSYYGDTTRMKTDLLPELKYKSFEEGLETF